MTESLGATPKTTDGPDYMDFLSKAKMLVAQYYNRTHLGGDDDISLEDVHITWFCKTLENWKALLIVSVPEAVGVLYFEVTHNGSVNETYLDVYKKWANHRIPDPQPVQLDEHLF